MESGTVPIARLRALAKRRAKRGKGTPMWDNIPLLQYDLVPIHSGWREVSISRPWRHDGEPLCVPYTEIEGYLNGMRIHDPLLRSHYIRMIRATDLIWMELRAKHKSKKK